jgi:acyl carrier protein
MTATGSSGPGDDLDQRVSAAVLAVAYHPATGPDSRAAGDAEAVLAELQSLELVELVVRLEADFDIQIAPEQLVRENFASVAAVRELVASCRSSGAASP